MAAFTVGALDCNYAVQRSGRRFERLIWSFRLVSIVPVVLSLMGSVGCFLVGARNPSGPR